MIFTEEIDEIYKWFRNEVLSRIWLNEKFQVCAKGGKWENNPRFEKKKDMPYLAHIVSGASMILRVIDIGKKQGNFSSFKTEELKLKLKRGLIGFLFHDFNKLTNSSYKMDNPKILLDLIKEVGLEELLASLDLNGDMIYDLAISTEIGTTSNALGRFQNPSLRFEKQVVRWADILSSIYNEPNPDLNEDIIIDEFTIYRDQIKSIRLKNSIFYALADLVKKELISLLENEGKTYLWMTENSIYYYSQDRNGINLSDIMGKISDAVVSGYKELVKPYMGIEFTDRKIKNEARGIIKFDRQAINDFIKEDKLFRSVIHPINGKIDLKYENNLIEYKNAVGNLRCIEIKLDKSENSFNMQEVIKLQEQAYPDDVVISERFKIFVIRAMTLELNSPTKSTKNHSGLRSDSAALEYLNNFFNENKKLLEPFRSAYKSDDQFFKSPFLALLFVAKSDWKDDEYERALKVILDKWNEDLIDLNEKITFLVRYILGIDVLNIEEVPDKSEMAIVSGYKAWMKGMTENTFGIKTNSSFTNKVITSQTQNFMIDYNYAIESLLRKNVALRSNNRNYSTNLIYLVFPGAIAYMNISDLLRSSTGSTSKDYFKNFISKRTYSDFANLIEEIVVGLDISGDIRYDNSYFLDPGEIENSEASIEVLKLALNFTYVSHLKCLITDSNSPPLENQIEIFRMDSKKFIVGDLKWDKLRCNQIREVLEFVDLFFFVSGKGIKGNSKNATYQVMYDFVKEPLSIFSHIKRNLMVNNKSEQELFKKKEYNFLEKLDRLFNYSINQAPREVMLKMKEIQDLADIAYNLLAPRFPRSTNERTWIIRDPIYALEKVSAEYKQGSANLEEFKDVVSSVVYKGLQRDKKFYIDMSIIDKYSETLIDLIKNSFDGRVPAGSFKSYLIDAFEFDLMKKFYERSNQAEGV